jgi:hypothetical protein
VHFGLALEFVFGTLVEDLLLVFLVFRNLEVQVDKLLIGSVMPHSFLLVASEWTEAGMEPGNFDMCTAGLVVVRTGYILGQRFALVLVSELNTDVVVVDLNMCIPYFQIPDIVECRVGFEEVEQCTALGQDFVLGLGSNWD